MKEEKQANDTEKLAILGKCWTKDKPDYACVFVTRDNGNYNLWRFEWEIAEPPEDATDREEATYYYLSWATEIGEEWDSIDNCNFDEYLVLEILPDMNGG